MSGNTTEKSLEDLLIAYEKTSKPLSEEYIQEKMRETYGNTNPEELKLKIQEVLRSFGVSA